MFTYLFMVNITLSVPDNLHILMRKHSEIKWSEVARKAIVQRLNLLEVAEEIASKSQLSKKDIIVLDKKIKTDALKEFLK